MKPEYWDRAKRALRRKEDRKSTRLNSSHSSISYAVFCLKKKNHSNEVLTPCPALLPHNSAASGLSSSISAWHRLFFSFSVTASLQSMIKATIPACAVSHI